MAHPSMKGPPVEYPERDGKPMAESDVHRDLMVYLIDALRRRFLGDPAFYVSGNLFVYYEEGNPGASVAPDVFVVRGVRGGERRTYKVWIEGKAPELVIELTSRSTHLEDLGNKRAIYERLGVKEYCIFDPEGDRFDPPFRAFRLERGTLMPVALDVAASGAVVFSSGVVGLDLHGRGRELRWVDPETGRALPTSLDLARQTEEQTRRAEGQARRAEEESRRAEEAQAREAAARARAEAAEAEVARLREALERRRSP